MADQGAITTILSSNMDSFTNLFDITIVLPTSVSDNSLAKQSNRSVRADGFTPPELSVNEYKTKYKHVELSRIGSKITGAREFSINFRLDSAFSLLNDLADWKHLWSNPSGEGNINFGGLSTATLSPSNYGTITVDAYGASGNTLTIGDANVADATSDISTSWVFYDVVLIEMGIPKFSRTSTEPISVSAKFIFGRCKEPGSSITASDNIPKVGATTSFSDGEFVRS